MAFEYIGSLLEEAVQNTSPVEVRGRVEQVVGTIIRAVVPNVKVGELCILRNPWEDWELRAEVVGFAKQVALLTPLGDLQGISPATEVIPTGEIHSIPVGDELLGRVLSGLGEPIDGGPALTTRQRYPVYADSPNPMLRKIISRPMPLGLRCLAACIFDEHREPFAAISISGPISRMTDDRVTELGALVIKAAKEVTLAYGGIR